MEEQIIGLILFWSEGGVDLVEDLFDPGIELDQIEVVGGSRGELMGLGCGGSDALGSGLERGFAVICSLEVLVELGLKNGLEKRNDVEFVGEFALIDGKDGVIGDGNVSWRELCVQ